MELLKNSQDPLVLAVASHDIGQYVKHYERGKKYIAFPCCFPRSHIVQDLDGPWGEDPSYGTDVPQ